MKENLNSKKTAELNNIFTKLNFIKVPVNWAKTQINNLTAISSDLIAQRDNLLIERAEVNRGLQEFKKQMRDDVEKLFLDIWENFKSSNHQSMQEFTKLFKIDANFINKLHNKTSYEYSKGLIEYLSLNENEKWREDIQPYWQIFDQSLIEVIEAVKISTKPIPINQSDTNNLASLAYLNLLLEKRSRYRANLFIKFLQEQIIKENRFLVQTVYYYTNLSQDLADITTKLNSKNQEIRNAGIGIVLKPAILFVLSFTITNLPYDRWLINNPKMWEATGYVKLKDELKFSNYGSEMNKALNFQRKILPRKIQAQANMNFNEINPAQLIASNLTQSEVASNILLGENNQNTLNKGDVMQLLNIKTGIPTYKNFDSIEEINELNKILFDKIGESLLAGYKNKKLSERFAFLKLSTSYLDLEKLKAEKIKNISSFLKEKNLPFLLSQELINNFDYTTHAVKTVNNSGLKTETYNSWERILRRNTVALKSEFKIEETIKNFNQPSVDIEQIKMVIADENDLSNKFTELSEVNFYQIGENKDIQPTEKHVVSCDLAMNYTNSNAFFLKMLNKSGLKAEEIYNLIYEYRISSQFVVVSQNKNKLSLKNVSASNKAEQARKFGQLTDNDPIDEIIYDMSNYLNNASYKVTGEGKLPDNKEFFPAKIKVIKLSSVQLFNRKESVYYILIAKNKKSAI
ncbi:hypothetical protein CAL7716_104770 (plasmid) [Calothrix sp. PCC 7716]|nr:hypothetical protein CAL7716_104770 [Calothrix sp. PCC 7716]